MGLFDFLNRKPKINSEVTKEVNESAQCSSYVLSEKEKLIFLDMVKGKRVEQLFYGNTSLIQEYKRDSLQKWLYNSAVGSLINISSGNESISNSLSKKELETISKNSGLPISGSKIDLVNRITEHNPKLFSDYKIYDWFILTTIGKEVLTNFKNKEKEIYNEIKASAYNLLMSNQITNSIDLAIKHKNSHPFNKSDFFINFSKENLEDIISRINSSNVFDKIGFDKDYVTTFKSVYCMYYLFPDIILQDRFEEILPGSVKFIKKSTLIKNKDIPFVDLNNLLRGYKVKKV